jgi:N-acetyl-gamma-glutamyl-phosphate reductase
VKPAGAKIPGGIPVGIVGAGGMLAGELMRLLEGHPSLALAAAVGRRGLPLAETQPHLFGLEGVAETREELIARLTAGGPAALVLALQHGESPAAWAELKAELGQHAQGIHVVDLAADFRLRDPALYERAYGAAHPAPAELAAFTYGLPELGRDAVERARRVAAPGCFATALQLAAVPAARAGLCDATRPWIFDAVTGSSGSGNQPKPGTHHPHRHGNLWAYALTGHRHEAELEQALAAFGCAAPLYFTPHSGPFARGIHLTASLPVARACDTDEARAVFAAAYEGEPFVEVLPDGAAPDLRRVVGSNRASIGVSVRGEVLTVLVTLDNLIKGGAGQALQCLNLMLGLPETAGLPRSGMGVC